MNRLSRCFVAGCLAWSLAACATTVVDPSLHRYFPGGVDRGDAMLAALDLENETLLIASDLLSVTRCSLDGAAICFASDYMHFASPPGEAVSWSVGGWGFHATGDCPMRIAGERTTAMRIVSTQKYGRFAFYYDRVAGRLLGWRLDYADLDGKPAHDVWMLKGLRYARDADDTCRGRER